MQPIFVNLRCMQKRMTGVQRYTKEVITRFEINWTARSPERPLGHVAGVLWDQLVLPLKTKSGLLWSPANTGPLVHPRHILTIHDLAVLKPEPWFSPEFRYYHSQIFPRLIKNALHIITDSNFIRSEVLSTFKLPEDRVTACPLGVSSHFFAEPCADLQHPYILAVGSLDPRKNLPRLFRAWTSIHRRFPEFELRVIGGGGEIFKRIDLSNLEKSRIRIVGNVTDEKLLEHYREATAFVYPSLYEGFGLPVLEAMAAGLPVLTSFESAMSEITQMEAVLVDPLSEDSISAGIIQLIESKELRSRLGNSGPRRARTFSWDKTASSIANILTLHASA